MFKNLSYKRLLINIIFILFLSSSGIFYFFYIYLPQTTQHGVTIKVPDLKGMNLNEVVPFLEKKKLKAIVSDSAYNDELAPLVVLEQNPEGFSMVKENRTIYLIINSKLPPLVKMPKLIDGSLRNAEMVLESYGLKIGTLTFVPDLAQNAVLAQNYKGKKIEPGVQIPRNSKVDLTIGNGLGSEEIEVPVLIGLTIDRAKIYIDSLGLSLGTVVYDTSSEEKQGTVISQKPDTLSQNFIHLGEMIDLFVAGIDYEEKKKMEEKLKEEEMKKLTETKKKHSKVNKKSNIKSQKKGKKKQQKKK